MQHLQNVRLHLVGHADDEPLSPGLSRVFGDNEGLSAERAGEVAEYLKTALGLPPEAISFEWAGDTQPIASNATPEGRAQNRRVEVEVWYDEFEEKIGIEEVVVPQEIKRVKICRTETVCKLRYLEGHERRARVRNLIAPLHYGDEAAEVPEEFVRQVEQTLQPPAGQAERHGQVHRVHGRRPAERPDRAHLRHPSRAVEGPRPPGGARGPGRAPPADRGDRERRPRRDAPGRFERDGARPRPEPAHRGRVLVRRPAPGAAGRAAALSRGPATSW